MEIPDVLRSELGDEDVYASVSLGDDDVLYLTPSRTLIYRAERLLSDESMESYPHDVERLSVSEGRRKTKFVFEYVDGQRTLKIPGNRTEAVLEHVLEAILRADGVIGTDEDVAGAFRFSELTFVVTDARVIKRIGNTVWVADDFETYDFEDVTGLDFEEGSVATQVVIVADGRPERIKAPNEQAPLVKRTLTDALLSHYDVASLAEFERQVGSDASGGGGDGTSGGKADDASDLDFGSGIDPLVSPDVDDVERAVGEPDATSDSTDAPTGERSAADESTRGRPPSTASDTGTGESQRPEANAGSGTSGQPEANAGSGTSGRPESNAGTAQRPESGGNQSAKPSRQSERTRNETATNPNGPDPNGPDADAAWPDDSGSGSASEPDLDADLAPEGITREDVEALTEQVADLTETVQKQNELLRKQHRAIKYLLNEAREE